MEASKNTLSPMHLLVRPGSQPFNEQGAKRKLFKELPISKVTLRGLGQVCRKDARTVCRLPGF